MAKSRAIPQHVGLLPPRQIREAFGTCYTFEGKEAVAIDAGKSQEDGVYLLAAHALDWIAPQTRNFAYDTHEPPAFL